MPAVLDSRCFAASLGYLEGKAWCSRISENLELLCERGYAPND